MGLFMQSTRSGGRGGRGGPRGTNTQKASPNEAVQPTQPEPSAAAATAVAEGLAVLGGQVEQLRLDSASLTQLIAEQAQALAAAADDRAEFQSRALVAFEQLSARTDSLEGAPLLAWARPRVRISSRSTSRTTRTLLTRPRAELQLPPRWLRLPLRG